MKMHFISYNALVNHSSYKLLIVADCRVNEDFIDALSNRINLQADLMYIDTSRDTKTPVLLRHFSYLALAFNAILKAKAYKVILFWQQFIGLYYSFISILLIKRTPAFFMPFIFKSRKGALGTIYKALIKLALQNNVIKGVICHSSVELKYLRKLFFRNKDKIHFILYGQSLDYENHRNNASNISMEKPYFFSGGTSNRDYIALITVAEEMNFPFVIACTRRDIGGIKITRNVKVYHDAYGKKFDALLKESLAVILIFIDPNISSGQIVLLKAMQMRKPIIITYSAGSADYVDERCAFLVGHNNPHQLRKVLEYVISNPQEAERRAINAYMRYKQEFTVGQFALRVADLIAKNLKEE